MSEEFQPRRILVAVDASPHSLAALEAAAELAAHCGGELAVLFVEDVNLLRLARLPHTLHVELPTGRARPLEADVLERQLREQAGRAEAALRAASTRLRLSATFRVVRGSVQGEVLQAAGECDLLILGRSGHTVAGPRRALGGTARAAAQHAPGPVLLWSSGSRLPRPVLAVLDAGDDVPRTLPVALGLARAAGAELHVIAVGETGEQASDLRARAEAWLQRHHRSARGSLATSRERLRAALRAEAGSVVVVDSDSPVLADPTCRALLEELGSLLLVR